MTESQTRAGGAQSAGCSEVKKSRAQSSSTGAAQGAGEGWEQGWGQGCVPWQGWGDIIPVPSRGSWGGTGGLGLLQSSWFSSYAWRWGLLEGFRSGEGLEKSDAEKQNYVTAARRGEARQKDFSSGRSWCGRNRAWIEISSTGRSVLLAVRQEEGALSEITRQYLLYQQRFH